MKGPAAVRPTTDWGGGTWPVVIISTVSHPIETVPPLAAPYEGNADPTHLVACIVPEAQSALAVHHG